ncbi:hypothetical protein CFBP498_46030 [Xanthomonas hortorum pv. vitians]|uniref:Uncharacterized protein n=1 Tax=Xanthomonas hortorum pv. vitians TaxID=83224 RepID=A0A6V7FBL3_9XANT|nr:hypothetical protein NCPPB940_35560 [Xanthomonas hortorum pv. taraxaci]CAD0350184.1 hypothetical protein NCPPB940_35560 [Xanthomonas hortorum pv. taraxaci]CAD0361002.1 hypothetical protein CFBP498_46030 [Xanthomonas hortorum pv. vitians]CAD0361003.1 hypothetical protein CFBP498_46030 [Xanthomonas hortorum pv. vitians]
MGNREWGIGRAGAAVAVAVFLFGSQESERTHSTALTIPHSRFPIPGADQRANGNKPNSKPPANISIEINTAHFSVKR